ncbi:MAG: cyclopropane-fatty-acyl-phospholipid synthase [Parvibaculaceae bacterium]|nr:cyclopropane-fatty-acyl-phospholipid synthase [Parvibaculaceae bacterium]
MFGVLLRQVVARGTLVVVNHAGQKRTFGDGTGDPVVIRLMDAGVALGLTLNPYLKLGEAYMDGRLVIDAPHNIYDFLVLVLSNLGRDYPNRFMLFMASLRRLKRRLDQHNPVGKAKQNVAHHYDLDGGIYDLFLDADRQYSCAYYERPDMTLEEAQLAKKRHICAKLNLQPGQKVLDIGCGWGGLALYLAEEFDVEVVGVTLSEEQHRLATRRAAERGLSNRVTILLQDYRTLTQRFDRIVSVGMFEHVGVGHFPEYFSRVRDLLTEDGVALIHTIGRLDPPGSTNPWIAKYIFPGGYIPALSEVASVVEKSGLILTDLEVLRLHYAETLKEWRRRFMARRDIAAKIYDERFCRMWEFYLAGSESSFRFEGMVNFQFQITKTIDALPITRDYMFEREKALRAVEIPGKLATAD